MSAGHRSTLRRLSALAGAKGVNALVAILRGKLTAVVLGPAGMGIGALLWSTASTIQQASGMGVNLSGVKEVASADGYDPTATLRRLALATSLIAALATLLLAPWLSELTFGSGEWCEGFRWLSAGVFFTSLAAGEFTLLQGRRMMQRLARASAAGAVAGLLPAVPLYIYMGTAGIVPSLIIAAAAQWASLRIAAGRTPDGSQHDRRLAWSMLRAGAVMMSSQLAAASVAWLLIVGVRYFGSVDTAGYYQAANGTVLRATEVVFAAMSLDFFPAIAAVAASNMRLRVAISRQTELAALIAAPMCMLLMLLAPLAVEVLLDRSFLAAVPLLRWLAFGAMLKALAYPPGYVAFVKNNPRVFMLMETVGANLIELLLPLGAYIAAALTRPAAFTPLEALGAGYCAAQLLTLVMYNIVNRRLYGITPGRRALRYTMVATVAAAVLMCLLNSFKLFTEC